MALDLPNPIGFVLSGGATGGALQVGMLRALHEAGVVPDLVVGTSAGAINGAILAGDPANGWQELDRVWAGLERRTIFPYSLRDFTKLVRNRRHLFSTDGLTALIDSHKPTEHIEDLAIPFGAVAAEAISGRPVMFTEGPLEPALRASAAIPGVFPRVQIDGVWYWDGGIAANVPVRQAVELGAASLVVLDGATGGPKDDLPESMTHTFLYVTGVLMRHQIDNDLAHVSGDLPVVYLPRYDGGAVSPFDFDHTAELVDFGHRRAAAFLETLQVSGPGLYEE